MNPPARPDLRQKYIAIINPLEPIIDEYMTDKEKVKRLHRIGLINMLICLQDILQHTAGQGVPIPLPVMAELISPHIHHMADRMSVITQLDADLLEVIIEGLTDEVVPIIKMMNLDWDAEA